MTMTDEKMDELANYQIDAMDSSDVVEMITDSLIYARFHPLHMFLCIGS